VHENALAFLEAHADLARSGDALDDALAEHRMGDAIARRELRERSGSTMTSAGALGLGRGLARGFTRPAPYSQAGPSRGAPASSGPFSS
jgi:hypothetical protein